MRGVKEIFSHGAHRVRGEMLFSSANLIQKLFTKWTYIPGEIDRKMIEVFGGNKVFISAILFPFHFTLFTTKFHTGLCRFC